MVMSNLEVDVLDELGSGLKFLLALGSPQLVPEVTQAGSHASPFECGLDSFAGCALGL